MSERIVSVGWSSHAILRLKQRLNADPGDVDDLLVGRLPVVISAAGGNAHCAVDVPHVCRFVVARDANPKRVGCWVVVSVLDWDQRKARGGNRQRVPVGSGKGKRKRLTLTDEDLQWIEQL